MTRVYTYPSRLHRDLHVPFLFSDQQTVREVLLIATRRLEALAPSLEELTARRAVKLFEELEK